MIGVLVFFFCFIFFFAKRPYIWFDFAVVPLCFLTQPNNENAILFIYVSRLIEHRQDRQKVFRDEQGNNCRKTILQAQPRFFRSSTELNVVFVRMRYNKFSLHL